MRVLVVDDEPMIAHLVEVVLTGPSVEVEGVGTLAEARGALTRGGYDAVLLDLSLPDGDGEELLAELRRSGTLPRVVVFSAVDQQRIRHVTHRYRVAWLPKPFDTQRLRRVLGLGHVAA